MEVLLILLFIVLSVLTGVWIIDQVRTGDQGWRVVGIIAVAYAVYGVLTWLL